MATIRQTKYFFELVKLLGYSYDEAKDRAKAKYKAEHFNEISIKDMGSLIHFLEGETKKEGISLEKKEEKEDPNKYQQALSEPKVDSHLEFRQWSKKVKKMEYTKYINFGFVGGKLQALDYGDSVFMQFTGRLDDNGKKIFDFDLVKSFLGKLYLVQWSYKDLAWVIYPEDSNEDLYLASLGKVTLVGNVYEGIKE